jgi:hypothetical protein
VQQHISVTPILGLGNAQSRAQNAINQYIVSHPGARIAAIPDGPYTLLCGTQG